MAGPMAILSMEFRNVIGRQRRAKGDKDEVQRPIRSLTCWLTYWLTGLISFLCIQVSGLRWKWS